jgi:hypothetical protein
MGQPQQRGKDQDNCQRMRSRTVTKNDPRREHIDSALGECDSNEPGEIVSLLQVTCHQVQPEKNTEKRVRAIQRRIIRPALQWAV